MYVVVHVISKGSGGGFKGMTNMQNIKADFTTNCQLQLLAHFQCNPHSDQPLSCILKDMWAVVSTVAIEENL